MVHKHRADIYLIFSKYLDSLEKYFNIKFSLIWDNLHHLGNYEDFNFLIDFF